MVRGGLPQMTPTQPRLVNLESVPHLQPVLLLARGVTSTRMFPCGVALSCPTTVLGEMEQQPTSRSERVGIGAALVLLLLVDLLDGAVGRDFAAYFHAGTVATQGGDLYTALDFPFVYMPPYALAFAPFANIGHTAAAAVWTATCWAVAVAGCLAWARAVGAVASFGVVAGCAVLFYPAYAAVESLNVESTMFLLLVLCSPLTARRTGRVGELLGGLLLGGALLMKPYYLPVAGVMAHLQRRGALTMGLGVGATIILVWSMADATLWEAFLDNAGRGDTWRFDAWQLPVVGLVLSVVWLLGAVKVWRQGGEDAWVYALTLSVLWPRMLMYSYLVGLPLLLFLSRGHRARRRTFAALFLLFSTPVGLLLSVELLDGNVVIREGGIGYLVTTALYWFALLLLSVWTWRTVTRPQQPAELTDGRAFVG